MKAYVILTSVLLLGISVSAQLPMGMSANGRPGQSVPNMGRAYGKIVDSTGKPVADVSIVLLQSKFDTVAKRRKEVLLKGLTTKANGEFSFEQLPIMGALKLKISASGFKPVEQTVAFQMKMGGNGPRPAAGGGQPDLSAVSQMASAFDKDLGKIILQKDVQQLQSVTVTATSSRLKMDIDKKVFNVDRNIVSAGGTALDVMRNVPSVQVDIDGNVKLRNSPPQIYVEGRPTTLSLDQIPADAIESVEVITNPSAKFDASGGNTGILNIILKKNKRTGYNGNLRAGVDKRGAVNGGGDFTLRQGKLNITTRAMVNQMKGRTSGTTERNDLQSNPQTIISQSNNSRNNGAFVFGQLGFDWFVTNRTTFSLNGIKVHGEFKPKDWSTAEVLSSTQKYASRVSNNNREFNANGFQFGFKQLFPKQGEELTADANYFSGKNNGGSSFITDSLNSERSLFYTEEQRNISTGSNKFLTVQTDYVNPLSANTKLEAGLRAQINRLISYNDNLIKRNNETEFKLNPAATSNYESRNDVYAAYVSLSSSVKSFGYKLGLRAESSSYTGDLLNTKQTFENDYPISLFPSVFLSQKLKKNQEVQFSYTRRINRPNFFQLIPFTDSTDKLNITRGNPDLVPEFTNSAEVSYSKSFKGGNNILASIYYKHTDDLITRYLEPARDLNNNPVLISGYINANSSYATGAEFTTINNLKKWWDVTTNINVYNSKVTTEDKAEQQEALWSWFGKINNNFKLPKNFTVQLSADYQSKTNLAANRGGNNFGGPPGMSQAQSAAQGYIKSIYGVDLAVKKSFLKNNVASATLSFSDIFRTRINEQYSQSRYFTQTYSRLRDPQMVRLTFAYRFGQMDMSLFKRKNMKGDMEGTQGAMQMGQ